MVVLRELELRVAAARVALGVGAGGLQRTLGALGFGALAEGFAMVLEEKKGAGAGVEVCGDL